MACKYLRRLTSEAGSKYSVCRNRSQNYKCHWRSSRRLAVSCVAIRLLVGSKPNRKTKYFPPWLPPCFTNRCSKRLLEVSSINKVTVRSYWFTQNVYHRSILTFMPIAYGSPVGCRNTTHVPNFNYSNSGTGNPKISITKDGLSF